MGRDELLARLRGLDRAAALLHPDRAFRVVFVGGGALVLLGCLARATADLDALQFPSELVPLMEQYDLSGRVTAYLDHFAINFEDRLVRVPLETASVEYYTASLEDLIVSKLHSNRPTDRQDIRRPEVLEAVDWEALAIAAEETELSSLIPRRHREFMRNYEEYREECAPLGD